MLKRIFLGILVIASLAAIGYTLFQTEQLVENRADIASAIPEDAIVLLEMDDLKALWDKLKDGSIIWEELAFTESVSALSSIGATLDSALFYKPAMASYLDRNKAYCSLHDGGGEVQTLFALVLKKDLDIDEAKRFYSANFDSKASFSEKDYEGAVMAVKDSSSLCFTSYKGFLLFSSSQVLLERSIRAINTGEGLLLDKQFQKSRRTAGKSHLMYSYVNYERMGSLMNKYRRQEGFNPFFDNFADWGEMDVSIKSNAVLMTGLVSGMDSVSAYLSVFQDQEALSMDLIEVLPVNTASFLFLGLKDPGKFNINHENYLHAIGRYNRTEKVWLQLREEYSLEKSTVMESVAGQLLVASLEGDALKENGFCVIDLLEENDLSSNDVFVWDDEYRGYPKGSLKDARFLSASFGLFFKDINGASVAMLDRKLVIANSEKTLKNIINSQVSKRSLANDEHFQELEKDISTSTSLTYYVDLSRSPGLLKDMLAPDYAKQISDNTETLREFQALCLQFEHERGDQYYQNLLLKYNPVYKKETSSMWELALDTTFSNRIWSARNHRNGLQEVVVQDDANKLYLISTTGKVLWSRDLKEPILSEVNQIDIYKNGKLQLLFNTASHIYLIDRLGRDVEGYPIGLPAKATSKLALLDYDKNKNYRLLIGTAEGMVHNFGADGKAVKGWAYKMKGRPVVGEMKHFSLGNKDFISCIDAEGDLFFLNRKGELRHDAGLDLLDYNGESYFINKGKGIADSQIHYFRKDQNLWTQRMDGEAATQSFEIGDKEVFAASEKGEFFILSADEIKVYPSLNAEMSVRTLPETCTSLQLIEVGRDQWFVSTSESGNVYLQTKHGEDVSGFPITGSTRAIVRDMDGDGNSDMVIGDKEGVLYMYTLYL